MSTSRGHDDEHEQQKQPEHHEQHGKSGAHRAETKAGGESEKGGAKASAAPTAAGAKAAIAPRVHVVSPTQHGTYDAGVLPVDIEVFGAPGSNVVIYLTVYKNGKIHHDHHAEVTLDASGLFHGRHFVNIEAGKFGLHVRAQNHAGLMSALRVVEFESPMPIETKGGGV